jgi:uncharacterized protein with von Willebrand factor type A (vWA) domain
MSEVIKKDALDKMEFEMTKESYGKVDELCNTDTTESLASDVFSSFYKMKPQISEEASGLQKDLVQSMMNMQEYHNIKASTEVDTIASSLATVEFAPEIIGQLQQAEKKREEQRKNGNQKGKSGNGKGQGEGEGEGEGESLEDILGEKGMGRMRNAIRESLEKAQEKADEWGEIKAGWGISDDELQKVSADERFKIAEQLMNSSKFKKVADMMGRFKNVVDASAATVYTHGQDEIVDIGLGGSLARMLPSEYFKMEELDMVFYKDFVEKNLLNYNLKGVENLGKGPIICAVDCSSSMDGHRDQLAKSIAMSLAHLSEKQKRIFGYLTFNTKVKECRIWSKENGPDLQDKMWIAETGTGGGTDYFPAIEAAFGLRDTDKDLKPADIVFITDGECNLSESQIKWIEEKKRDTDVRIHGICVTQMRPECLASFCDQISMIDHKGEIETVKDVVKIAASNGR